MEEEQPGYMYETFAVPYLQEIEAKKSTSAIPLTTRLYCFLRWCEDMGKWAFMAAGNDFLAQNFNTTPAQIDRALKRLRDLGLIQHVWCDRKIYRNKTKVWMSVVRLADAATDLERMKVLKRGAKSAEMLTKHPQLLRLPSLETSQRGPETSQRGPETSQKYPAHTSVPPQSENIREYNKIYRSISEIECNDANGLDSLHPQALPACEARANVDMPSCVDASQASPARVASKEKSTTPFDASPNKVESVRPNLVPSNRGAAAQRRIGAVMSEVRKSLGLPPTNNGAYFQGIKRWVEAGYSASDIIEANHMMMECEDNFYNTLNPLARLSQVAMDWYAERKKLQRDRMTPRGFIPLNTDFEL